MNGYNGSFLKTWCGFESRRGHWRFGVRAVHGDTEHGDVVDWKRASEAGQRCGILGCEAPREKFVPCPYGCLNHYCPNHFQIHAHAIDKTTGKARPGARVVGDRIVVEDET